MRFHVIRITFEHLGAAASIAMMRGREELIMRMPMGRQEKRRVRVLEVRVPLMWKTIGKP